MPNDVRNKTIDEVLAIIDRIIAAPVMRGGGPSKDRQIRLEVQALKTDVAYVSMTKAEYKKWTSLKSWAQAMLDTLPDLLGPTFSGSRSNSEVAQEGLIKAVKAVDEDVKMRKRKGYEEPEEWAGVPSSGPCVDFTKPPDEQ